MSPSAALGELGARFARRSERLGPRNRPAAGCRPDQKRDRRCPELVQLLAERQSILGSQWTVGGSVTYATWVLRAVAARGQPRAKRESLPAVNGCARSRGRPPATSHELRRRQRDARVCERRQVWFSGNGPWPRRRSSCSRALGVHLAAVAGKSLGKERADGASWACNGRSTPANGAYQADPLGSYPPNNPPKVRCVGRWLLGDAHVGAVGSRR